MDRFMASQIIAGMLSRMGLGVGSAELVTRIHATKKGSGRSKGMKVKRHESGNKLAKKAFLGTCTLRNGVGAAGRLALEGKLCKK